MAGLPQLCFATHNPDKLREVKQLLKNSYNVVGLNDIGCNEEIPETGTTLDENSEIKAVHVKMNYDVSCFADDTGLEVDALNGEPGVYSARYAGDQRDSRANIDLLLAKLEGKSNRSAQFRTIITLILDDEKHTFEGIVRGTIHTHKSGSGGFGYDPVFIPEGGTRTFAEMNSEEKNSISHRGNAIRKLVHFLNLRNQ